MNLNTQPTDFPKTQRGAVLVVALVFLLLLTILGVTTMSTTSLEEKMANNVKDRNLAFQSAETGILIAENWLYGLTNEPDWTDNANGLYLLSTTATAVWETANIWAGSSVVTYPSVPYQANSGGLANVTTQPKYVVEHVTRLRDGSLRMSSSGGEYGDTVLRITARGTGGTDQAQVMLQTTYKRPF